MRLREFSGRRSEKKPRLKGGKRKEAEETSKTREHQLHACLSVCFHKAIYVDILVIKREKFGPRGWDFPSWAPVGVSLWMGGCFTGNTVIWMEDGEMEGKQASRRIADRLRIPVIGANTSKWAPRTQIPAAGVTSLLLTRAPSSCPYDNEL